MFYRHFRTTLALLAALLILPVIAADSVEPALNLLTELHQAAAKSQARIDKLDDDMRRMRDEMRQGELRLENAKAELLPLEQQARELSGRRAQLERELSAGVPGQVDLQVVMPAMLTWLERFIESDLPFLREQRRERLVGLRKLLAKEDISDADKLRALLEVVQVEMQYGRGVEASSSTLRFGTDDTPIELLRVGRLMLYYLEPGGTRQGFWNRSTRRWQALPEDERERLLAALRMAKGEDAPQLMELLLPTATAAQKP